MHPDLEVALEAARAGAAVVRAGFAGDVAVRLKGDVDPVTVIDTAAEAAIIGVISARRPGDHVLGEESGGSAWDAERVWIVDPLDGTINFLHGIPHVAVSVALWEEGVAQVGVVGDVMRDETFTAVAGGGAHMNGSPIGVSKFDEMTDSVVATGFPYDRRAHAAAYATTLGAVLSEVQGIRRFGSAALDLAWVACGRYDAYWEYGLAPWDAAAGALLVVEAGGRVTDHGERRHDLDSPSVVASNGHIHRSLSKIVAAHLPEHLR